MNLFNPKEVAENYIKTGVAKVNTPIIRMFLLAVLAGMFIALAGIGATTASVSVPLASVAKLISACVFPAGLVMVLLAGSELFTGNCLLAIPLLQKEIKLLGMIKNLVIVYIGNFVGSILVAAGVVFSHQASLFNNELAVSIISAASSKCSMGFADAFIKGIFCNFLVCIAVWIAFAAKDVSGKVIGLFFPIMVFVVCGFEHSVANMYYISAGIFAKMNETYLSAATNAGIDVAVITWKNFLITNLVPVTLGNIVGGSILVGCIYWTVYLKKQK